MSDVVRFYRSPQVLPAPAMDGNFDSVFAMFMVLVSGDGTQPGVGWELLHKDATNRMFALKSPAGFIVRFWANILHKTAWGWRIQAFSSLPNLNGNGGVAVTPERCFEIGSENSISYSPSGFLITASKDWFFLHLDYNRTKYAGATWFIGIPVYIDKFNLNKKVISWFNKKSKESFGFGIHENGGVESIFNSRGDYGVIESEMLSKQITNMPVDTKGDIYTDKIFSADSSGNVIFYLPSIRGCFTIPLKTDGTKCKTNDVLQIGSVLSCVVSGFHFQTDVIGASSRLIFVNEY
ncbi:MAG: hypothetical protein ACRC1V_10665 [Plesiomonas sp.]